MLSILLLYFVWKRFADLAESFGKSKNNGWIGIALYVGGLLFIGFVAGILNSVFDWGIDFENNSLIKFMDLPIGVSCCYLGYVILEKKWKSEEVVPDSIDEIGKETKDSI